MEAQMRGFNDVAAPYSNSFRYSVVRLTCIISVLLLVAASMLSIHSAITRAASPLYVTLPDSVPSQVANAQSTGHYSSNVSMSIGIMLYPNNQAKIDALYTQLYDAHSPLYHHWLRKKEFDSLFGPTSGQLALITQFLSQSGLHLIQGPGPLLIPAMGTTVQVEAAFHTTLNNYRLPNGTTFFANSTNIQIPMNLRGIVEGVFGLNNIVKNRSLLNAPTSLKGVKPSYGGGPNGSGLTPSQIAGIYDANPVYTTMNTKGQGVTLGLMEFSHFTPGDVFAYESQYGLGTVALQYVSVQGGTTDHSGASEVELDIEMMVALAPLVDHIQVYKAPNNELGDIWGYYQIAEDDQSNAVSTSWGDCEATTLSSIVVSEAQSFKIMALQGQSMFAATGDNGAFACLPFNGNTTVRVQDPSSQPYITAVGGTSFAGTFNPGTNQNPNYPTGKEKAWNENCTSTTCTNPNGGGGGGVSRLWAMPSYQTGPGVNENKYSKTGTWCKQTTSIPCREIPDVSLNSDGNSGYSIYCTDSGDKNCSPSGWLMIGGTSAAAPLWAAIAGLIDSYHFAHGRTSLGFANPFLYEFNATNAYSNVFHGIPKG
ncbi:MAG TPA: S53 family peptidase [Ktedonobacteraceae bacterium]|nr:S53 family peptidase [Ktedonobacteraceae bacterium]